MQCNQDKYCPHSVVNFSRNPKHIVMYSSL